MAIVTTPLANFLIRLRAVCALIALLPGAIFAPVTLATQTTDEVCSMACCIEEKHCCCKPTKIAVKGQKRDAGEKHLTGSELSQPCPEGCATSPAPLKFSSRALLRPAVARSAFLPGAAIHAPPVLVKHHSVALPSASPRAPPALLPHLSV
jgi:hypothetical protein